MQTCRHFIKKPYFKPFFMSAFVRNRIFSMSAFILTMQTCGHKNIQLYYCNCYYVVKAILYS